MIEKRKTPRKYLLYYTRVYDIKTHRQIGHLVDITISGAMVIGPDPIAEGLVCKLRIELTNDIAQIPHMDLTVKTIWCHPDIDPDLYNIGFKIEKISLENRQIIQRIVETYGFRDNSPTSG